MQQTEYKSLVEFARSSENISDITTHFRLLETYKEWLKRCFG